MTMTKMKLKKTILINLHNTQMCNEIIFRVMTMTCIYYYMIRKHLFFLILLLYTELVLLCCVRCFDFKYLHDG